MFCFKHWAIKPCKRCLDSMKFEDLPKKRQDEVIREYFGPKDGPR